jgi:hypothetical protein
MNFEGLYCIFLFCQIVLRECIGSLSACLFTACLYTENGMVSCVGLKAFLKSA